MASLLSHSLNYTESLLDLLSLTFEHGGGGLVCYIYNQNPLKHLKSRIKKCLIIRHIS